MKENKQKFKKEFEEKWQQFIQRENLIYHVVKIRYIRKKDNLVLIKVGGINEYIQLHFDIIDGQIEKLLEAFKNDEYVKINKE